MCTSAMLRHTPTSLSWVSKYILVSLSLKPSIQLKGPTGRLGHRAQANDKEDKQQKLGELGTQSTS